MSNTKEQKHRKTDSTPKQPKTLLFGILSLVLPVLFGIVFGAIGRREGKKCTKQGGTLTGSSKTGYILCLIGLIWSIVMTVAFVALIFIMSRVFTTGTDLPIGNSLMPMWQFMQGDVFVGILGLLTIAAIVLVSLRCMEASPTICMLVACQVSISKLFFSVT